MRAVLLLLVVSLAGCVAEDAPEDAETPTSGRIALSAIEGNLTATNILSNVPPMQFDADAALGWWENVATNYPKHDSNLPTNALLREHLVAELQSIGLNVEVRSYAAQPRELPLPDTGQEPLQYHVVIGTLPGKVDNRIGLVAHYDTQAATIHGAYDDASGVAAQFHICKALAVIQLNHTLSCVFFDAEEQGLVSSLQYVNDAVASGEHVYDFVMGYDMTGINWPGHNWNMYMMTGPTEHIPWLQRVGQEIMHGVLGYPDATPGQNATTPAPSSGVVVLDTHDRNSDERRFKEVGIPIYRFAGGRHAADYPQYHQPLDTVDYVYDFTGGRSNFKAGFSTVVEASYHTALVLDHHNATSLQSMYG